MKSLLRLERQVFARRFDKATDALIVALDETVEDPRTATRVAAALSAIAAAPGHALESGQRLALLERRRAIRAVFTRSAYGSGAHLMKQIGLCADGAVRFEHAEQIDKYMVLCPTADLDPSVVRALARLPIEAAAPLILSMLTDPPDDRAVPWWLRVAALAMRLAKASFGPEMYELATRAWCVEPTFVTSAIRASVLAQGAEDATHAPRSAGPAELVIAVADDVTTKVATAHLAALSQHYRVTVLTKPTSPASVAALRPDIVWIPKPGAAAWTCVLAAIRNAPIQIAADHAPTASDVDDAIAFLLEAAAAAEAA